MRLKKIKRKIPVVPVMVFLTLFGGIVGYGYFTFFRKKVVITEARNALNSKLPVLDAGKQLNKLEQYLQAERDSALIQEQRSQDPNTQIGTENPKTTSLLRRYASPGLHFPIESGKGKSDEEARAVEKRMSQIHALLKDNNTVAQTSSFPLVDTIVNHPPNQFSSDPELNQLEGMLDKIMQIQHPELVKTQLVKKDSNGHASANLLINNSVSAVVHSNQSVFSGATVKLRLTDDLVLNTRTIPKGSFVFGICQVNNERLNVRISNLAFRGEVLPVALTVYDIDGIEGIYIPGNISREVIKEGTDQAIQSFNVGRYDPSLTGQVAGVGLQATKALLSRKVKQVRVSAKAGHRILLKNAQLY